MEQRKFPRIKTRNFVSFVKYNKNGHIESHKTGVALDVSQHGIGMETREEIGAQNIRLIFTSSDNSLIEIKAKVVNSRQIGEKKFQTGLSLQGKPDENLRFVTNLVRAYHTRKKSLNHNLFL
jgi:hypothetical protein